MANDVKKKDIINFVSKVLRENSDFIRDYININDEKKAYGNIRMLFTEAVKNKYNGQLTEKEFLVTLSGKLHKSVEETQRVVLQEIRNVCDNCARQSQSTVSNKHVNVNKHIHINNSNSVDVSKFSALDLIKEDWKNLKYITKQTPFICKAALMENAKALQFVRNQTKEICMFAVEQDPHAIKFIKNLSPKDEQEVCMMAVMRDGTALKHVKNKTPEICRAAFKQSHGYAMFHARDVASDEIALSAVSENGLALRDVKDQSPAICLVALKNNPEAAEYISDEVMDLLVAKFKKGDSPMLNNLLIASFETIIDEERQKFKNVMGQEPSAPGMSM